MNRKRADGKNQIVDWISKGYVSTTSDFKPAEAAQFCSPFDDKVKVEERARVWLDVNCAMCHRPDGPGNANIDLRYSTKLTDAKMINEKPAQGDLGIANACLVTPGDTENSILFHRINTLGAGRMPNIGSNQIDVRAVELIKTWIKEMSND